ncbi:GlxA family transcriptional regulator [Maricurvus nonylphenolicus]|uniref:GlxA family transcriptional regulator n=1 Tax=Maricurvus nonylphenolicus TaxID=1008307 RepID=UPI0036F2608C
MSDHGIRVGILLSDGIWMSMPDMLLDILQSVNMRRESQLFRCDLVTPLPGPVQSFSGRKIYGDVHIEAVKERYDVIYLCHFWGDVESMAESCAKITPWLQDQYANGALIAGVSSGAFWAAQAGLLDGRKATSYWRHMKDLAKRFPKVEWQDNQALVEDANLLTSNAGNAAMDLAMHLVQRFAGEEMATEMAKDITHDTRRTYDLTLFNIAGLRQHRDSSVHKAQDWLDSNYHDKVEFNQLADDLGMSSRTFIRRFQKATGEKPTRYLQRLRVEAAKHQLINSDNSIKTISLDVGYRDFGFFSQVFKSLTEVSPREFRRRFRPGNS